MSDILLGPLPWPIDLAPGSGGGGDLYTGYSPAPAEIVTFPWSVGWLGAHPLPGMDPEAAYRSPILDLQQACNPFYRCRLLRLSYELTWSQLYTGLGSLRYLTTGTCSLRHRSRYPDPDSGSRFIISREREIELADCMADSSGSISWHASRKNEDGDWEPAPEYDGSFSYSFEADGDPRDAPTVAYWGANWMDGPTDPDDQSTGNMDQTQLFPFFRLFSPSWFDSDHVDQCTPAGLVADYAGEMVFTVDLSDRFPDHVYTVPGYCSGFSGEMVGNCTGSATLTTETGEDAWWGWDGKYDTSTGEPL